LKLQGKEIEVTTLPELADKEYQIAIIDAPHVFEKFSEIVKSSDFILVPVKGSLVDR